LPKKLKFYSVLEALLGRRLLMRTGRFLFLGARRELVNSPGVNGEYQLVRTMADFMRKTGGQHTCFDVGANLGDWTAELLSQAGGADVTIHAFEPAPAQYGHMTQRLAGPIAAGQVTQQKLALAAEQGTAEFLVTGESSGNNAIVTSDAVAEGRRIKVSLDTVDHFCSNQGLKAITFVKVDTEGNDLNVIFGAHEMLVGGQIGVLQFEYNYLWVRFGHMLHKVFTYVERLEYVVAQITQDGLEVHSEWHPELERFFETNFALVRKDMLAHLPHRLVRFDDANTLKTA
jgi:FkbM family methyltransferase